MNDTSLLMLERARLNKLKEYKLDIDSIRDFEKEVKRVDAQKSADLGKELFEFISDKKRKADSPENMINKVTDLIIKGADVNYKDEKKGDFPLLICARKGYFVIAHLLLRAKANVNQTNNYLTTALMAAARHGHKELLEMLILLGADVNAMCLDGDTALMSAKRHRQQECFDVLVKSQACLNQRNQANQSILEIPGDISFETESSISSKPDQLVSKDDAFTLIEEAQTKLKDINPLVRKRIK